MTPVMQGVVEPRERQDLRVPKENPLLAHQAPRDHLVPQEEVMTGDLDHPGHLDLQDHPYQGLTGVHILSVFLDPQDHLELLDYLDNPQG